jgi:hypothetical protein
MFQSIFFQKCFRFGNKTRDSLRFTKKMTENLVIDGMQLWVAFIFWLSPIAATSYCGNKVQMIRALERLGFASSLLTYSISGELFGHDYRQQLPYYQLIKFQNISFKRKFRFGNKTRNCLHFKKKERSRSDPTKKSRQTQADAGRRRQPCTALDSIYIPAGNVPEHI